MRARMPIAGLALAGTAAMLAGTTPGTSVAAPAAASTGATGSRCSGSHWIATWATAPSDATSVIDPALEPTLAVGRQSFRMVVTPHSSGRVIRVRLTNRFGKRPLALQDVTVGVQAKGAAVRAKTLREVRFDGSRSATIPAGQDLVSDPVHLRIRAFQHLTISYYVPGSATLPTEHFNANMTSYYTTPGAGDRADSAAATGFSHKTLSWFYVAGIDVRAPRRVGTLVAFGDSITDGFVTNAPTLVPQSKAPVDTDVRYPDFLQRRLLAHHIPLVTVDEGISGNRVLQPGLIPEFGPAATKRIGKDGAGISGATDAIILEGINDLGAPPYPTAQAMEDGYVKLIDALHRRHIHVLLGTIMPAGKAILDGPVTAPKSAELREQINAWIRRQHHSDGIVDFDKAMRDPAHPGNLNPAYADGDNLHPNPTGYRAMAAAVPLGQLQAACH